MSFEEKLEKDLIPFLEGMLAKERESQNNLKEQIKKLEKNKSNSFFNFFFPFFNYSLDLMILTIHSFIKESELSEAKIMNQINSIKKFLNYSNINS